MSGRRGAAALAILIAVAVVQLPSASALAGPTAISGATLRELATNASRGDPASLAELRQVQQVDGQPADLNVALSGASAPELRARLAALAASLAPASREQPSPAAARALAGTLTANQSAHPVTLFSPVSALLRKLHLSFHIHGLPAGAGPWGVAAILVLVAAGFGARRAIGRRGSLPGPSSGRAGEEREDPQRLQREAEAAERSGAFAEAIRLRFRAGLLLLGAGSAIEYRPSLLTGEVARTLRSEQFDALAASFERVAYRDQRAGPDDAVAAREGWRRLLRGRRSSA